MAAPIVHCFGGDRLTYVRVVSAGRSVLVTGQQVLWGFTGTGGNATAIIDGSVVITAARTGNITP